MGGVEESESPCVRLFFSVDLVGSTEFKQKEQKDGQAPWIDVFKEFYQGFPGYFGRKLDNVTLDEVLRPKIVKSIGDELFMQVTIQGSEHARQIVRFFAKVLKEYKKQQLYQSPLKVKGTAWIAGFPLNNRRVTFPIVVKGTGAEQVLSEFEDFIGPSIDTGFRLANFSTPSKLVVSVDLALLLLRDDEGPQRLHFDGTQALKGVLAAKPYPIIWYQVTPPPNGEDSNLSSLEQAVRQPPATKALEDYCKAFVGECLSARSWLFPPYFADDPDFKAKPPWHEPASETNEKIDQRNFFPDPESAEPPAGAEPPKLEDPPTRVE